MATESIVISMLEYSCMLLLALIFGEFLRRVGQSEVIGHILLGIILGPSVLNLIHPSEIFEFLSELGAVVLLFIAGLETNLEMISRGGRRGITLAVLGAFFSFILGYLPVFLLTQDTMLSIFIGAASVATSVGITVKVFADLGLLRSEEAQTILVAAVADDIIGVLFLAIVINIFTSGAILLRDILYIIVRLVSFFIFMLGLSVIISKYVLMFITKLVSRGAKEIFAFSFALFSGYLAYNYGLSPIIGAYLAGVMLASSDIREELTRDISPIAFITVPIFFISVGLRVDLRVALIALLPAILITIAACIAKIISGILVFDPRKRENIHKGLILGTGMMPRGEVGFLFAKIGDTLGILSAEWYFSLVVMSLLTTFIAPILLTSLLGKFAEIAV